MAKKDAPLRIELPPATADRALTSKVGVVAIVGFALGIAWPRLLDLKVGPDVPGGSTPSTSARAAVPPPGQGSGVAGSAAPDASSSAPDEAGPSNQQSVLVGDGSVVGCANKKRDKVKDCGKISFDKTAKSRLGELARCPAAIGLEGKMLLGLTLNFEKNEVVIDGEKKKSGLPSDTVRGVIGCAGATLKGIELDSVPHTHTKYSLVYELSFYPPGKSPPEPAAAGKPAESEPDPGLGLATVTWEKALVRDNPPEGRVVFRLAQGTRVTLLELKDGWYRIESSKGKGWVYRQAIGK